MATLYLYEESEHIVIYVYQQGQSFIYLWNQIIKMPTKYKAGVENLPLRQINTHCPIIVIITDLVTNEVVSTIELDYAKFDDRKHMGRLTYWCVSNKHSMETVAKADVDLAYVDDGGK